MEQPDPKPAELMPKWWRIASTTALYAACLLWFVPFVLYFQGTVTVLGALSWLVAVVVFQFVLAKLISLFEYLATATALERLRTERDGPTPNFGEID